MIRKIIHKLKDYYRHSSSNRYSNYLRKRGVTVGEGTIFYHPRTANVDVTRPSLVTIGSNCLFNRNFTIITHDWVTGVFIGANMEYLPSSGRVTIGNNVHFAHNCMVLKGVTIGDNCFIGANSLVTKDIPSNSVAVGMPCKVVCSLEEYYKKRQNQCIPEALDYARSIQERYGRRPTTLDFWDEFPLFVDGDKIDQYPELSEIIKKHCGPTYENYVKCHKATFSDFDAFLKASGIE